MSAYMLVYIYNHIYLSFFSKLEYIYNIENGRENKKEEGIIRNKPAQPASSPCVARQRTAPLCPSRGPAGRPRRLRGLRTPPGLGRAVQTPKSAGPWALGLRIEKEDRDGFSQASGRSCEC